VESEIRRQEDNNKRKLVEAMDAYTKSRKVSRAAVPSIELSSTKLIPEVYNLFSNQI